MYLLHPNFANINGDGNYADITRHAAPKPGCKCGGKCKKPKGVGDIPTFLSTGDLTQLFVDPTTGGTSWSTVAIFGVIGVVGYMLLTRGLSFGLGGGQRQAALTQARLDYQRQQRTIRKKYGVFA